MRQSHNQNRITPPKRDLAEFGVVPYFVSVSVVNYL